MSYFFEWMRILYVYCTDFIINLANLTDWSYYEMNAIIFCFIYPLLTVGFPVLYWVQRKRLKNMQTTHSSKPQNPPNHKFL
ncbi:MAG: hypothetical protein AB8B69_06825 [Chitinophagales bacterium]